MVKTGRLASYSTTTRERAEEKTKPPILKQTVLDRSDGQSINDLLRAGVTTSRRQQFKEGISAAKNSSY